MRFQDRQEVFDFGRSLIYEVRTIIAQHGIDHDAGNDSCVDHAVWIALKKFGVVRLINTEGNEVDEDHDFVTCEPDPEFLLEKGKAA